jgi:hypothetical protein
MKPWRCAGVVVVGTVAAVLSVTDLYGLTNEVRLVRRRTLNIWIEIGDALVVTSDPDSAHQLRALFPEA